MKGEPQIRKWLRRACVFRAHSERTSQLVNTLIFKCYQIAISQLEASKSATKIEPFSETNLNKATSRSTHVSKNKSTDESGRDDIRYLLIMTRFVLNGNNARLKSDIGLWSVMWEVSGLWDSKKKRANCPQNISFKFFRVVLTIVWNRKTSSQTMCGKILYGLQCICNWTC